jgi:hypothetical protein
MLYKLTKGTLSRIRTSRDECEKLIEDGYKLDGEVDNKYNVINPNPIFEEKSEVDQLKEKLISLGYPKSKANRLGKVERLQEEIDKIETVEGEDDGETE